MKNKFKCFIGATIASSLIVLCAPSYANAETVSVQPDNNNTSSSATQISSTNMAIGVISASDDVDFYKYTVDVTGYYNVTLTDSGAQGKRWRLSVYDSSLKELEASSNLEYSHTTNSYNFKKGSVIFLKVENGYGAEGTEYSLTVNATQAFDWEQEYTDTKENAAILEAKTMMHGNIYSDYDVDYYKYTVGVTGHYNFTLKDAHEQGGKWKLTVFDPSLNKLESNINTDYNLTTNTYNFKEGTQIYLRVENCYGAKGLEYTLSVNETKSPDYEQELNNTKETATVIKANQTKYGNLYCATDVDYYKYIVDVNGYFNFTIQDLTQKGTVWNITVFDSSLNKIQQVIDYNNTRTSNTFNFKKGTILYIKFEDSYGTQNREYSLTVNAKKNANWEVENNDSYKRATALKSNKTKYGNLYMGYDVDYYSFTATKTGTVKTMFQFDAEDVSLGWNVTIYDSSKKEIETVYNIITDKTISFKATKGKKYYIVIRANSSYVSPNSITYELKVK